MEPSIEIDVRILVPLYGLRTEADVLRISNSVTVWRYTPESVDRSCGTNSPLLRPLLQVFPPSAILVVEASPARLLLPGSTVPDDGSVVLLSQTGESSENSFREIAKLNSSSLTEAAETIRNLRLFRSGDLRRGAMWIQGLSQKMVTDPPIQTIEVNFEFRLGGLRRAELDWMGAETDTVESEPSEWYEISADDMPYFDRFSASVNEAIDAQKKPSRLERALTAFENALGHEWPINQLLALFISLESLLLDKDEELSHRLAQRTANLLGTNPEKRRQIYKEIRDFYKLRSRVVHGDELKELEKHRLTQISALREYVRRLILSLAALGVERSIDSTLYETIDESSLDDDLRRDLQTKSSRLLHLN